MSENEVRTTATRELETEDAVQQPDLSADFDAGDDDVDFDAGSDDVEAASDRLYDDVADELEANPQPLVPVSATDGTVVSLEQNTPSPSGNEDVRADSPNAAGAGGGDRIETGAPGAVEDGPERPDDPEADEPAEPDDTQQEFFVSFQSPEEEQPPAGEGDPPPGPQPDAPQERPEVPGDMAALRAAEIERLREAHPNLSGRELERSRHLQDVLSNLAALYTNVERSGDPRRQAEEDRAQVEAIARRREQLALEREAGVFGPATREAYQELVNWLQSRAIPHGVAELDSMQLPIPPGCPLELPADQQQRRVSPELYRAMVGSGRLGVDMRLDTGRPPSEEDLNRLDAAFDWLRRANDTLQDGRGLELDRFLDDTITRNGLPEGWRRREGEDVASWRASAAEMIDLSVRTRNYVEAMQSLYRSSRDGDFPLELPPGTTLTLELNGRTRQITDQQLNDPEARRWLREGTLQRVALDLPEDLRQNHPANQQKIERLRSWLERHGERIDQAVGELVNLSNNPDAVIMFGDMEIRNGRGLFNARGEFQGVVNDRYQPQPGETLRDINLVGYDFSVERITEGENAGRYRIRQTIQAENVPWWAYQNARFVPGVERVGQPMVVEERIVDADAFIPVRDGNSIRIVQARNLEQFRSAQQFHYYFEKGLMATLDAAMLASALTGVGATLTATRAAATTGARAGLRLTAGEAAVQMAHHGVRGTVAVAGLWNNAAGPEWLRTARGLYFLGDISHGLARGGLGLLRGGRAAEAGGTMSATERVHTLLHGGRAVEGGEVLRGIPWLSQIDRGANIAFRVTEAGFAPIIVGELRDQIHHLRHLGQRDPAMDAVIQVGDGRGLQRAEPGAFDPANRQALEGTRAVLNSYADILGAGRSPETQRRVQEIFETAGRLLGPDATDEQRAQFRRQLTGNLTFSPDQIRQLEAAHPSSTDPDFRLSAQQLHELNDPERRGQFPRAVRELAERFAAERDRDVEIASRIALMYLARDRDGNLSEQAGAATSDVPSYTRRVITGYDNVEGVDVPRYGDREIPARQVEQTLSTQEVVAGLRRELERSDLGNRGIAVGDLLVRVGAMTHQQYGGLLQDVLRNPNSTREDRMRALMDAYGSRLATIVDGVRYQESLEAPSDLAHERARRAGESFGLTSADLMETLRTTAQQDDDPDVRAAAAAILYGLNEREAGRRGELLSGFNTMWQEAQGQPPGTFARRAREFLAREMAAAVPEGENANWVRERKLNAAASLALITPEGNAEQQRDIARAIAESISPDDRALTVRALDMLVPGRLSQLSREQLDDVRQAALALVRRPDNPQQEEQVLRVLQHMPALLRDSSLEMRQQLERQLQGLLTISRFNNDYAEHYPRLRAQAIDTLAEFGSQSSLNIIRSHVSTQPIRIGDQVVNAGEPDARVRLAAARALETLRDPELRNYMAQLIATESDHTVANRLRDVEFTQRRIERDSQEYRDIHDRTMTALEEARAELERRPHLENFDHAAWLRQNFPMLDVDHYRDSCNEAARNATSWMGRLLRSTTHIQALEGLATIPLQNQRLEQWRQLEQMARQPGEQGDRARRALYEIMTRNGSILGGQSGLTIRVQGHYLDTRYYNHDWSELAARALRDAAEPGVPGRDQTRHYIMMGLTRHAQLGPRSSDYLLEGLQRLGRPHRGEDPPLSRRETASILVEALHTDILRRDRASEHLQQDILRELGRLRDRTIYPRLEALVERSPFQSVQGRARETLEQLRDSVQTIWDETRVDQTSNPQQRAQRVERALRDTGNAERTVQEIFNAYKGYNLRDAADPGIPHLQVALRDSNERVRLAAARVLAGSDLPMSHPARATALQVLSELTVSASEPILRREAFQQLDRLQLQEPVFIGTPTGRMLQLERGPNGLTVSEFTSGSLTGVIYPNGTSARWGKDDAGNLNEFWQDGTRWVRRQADGRYTDVWESVGRDGRPRGSTWTGAYTLPGARGDRSYSYHQQGSSTITVRMPNGTYQRRPAPQPAAAGR